MDLISLLIYIFVNLFMVLWFLRRNEDIYKTPFWFGIISLGWFLPQAIGGYYNNSYPDNAYIYALLFSSLCSLGFWLGWLLAYRKPLKTRSWLAMQLDTKKAYISGVILCLSGFFFQYKLSTLPEEILAMTQWTGLPVILLFFSQVFKYGLLILWILYLRNRNWLSFRHLIFLIPCFILLLDAVVLRGRRSEMMFLTSILLMGFWFVKRKKISRIVVLIGLVFGIMLINSVGVYRSIMKNKDIDLTERLELAINADYVDVNEEGLKKSGAEFENYLYIREAVASEFAFDYGVIHWNFFVFQYVPAQLVGSEVKSFLMLPLENVAQIVRAKYGHYFVLGSTVTGYADAFSSFGWLGFIKFIIVGLMSGVLYRYSMNGSILAQVIYMMSLPFAMQSVTHDTNDFLIRHWIYFFLFVFPLIFFSRIKNERRQ